MKVLTILFLFSTQVYAESSDYCDFIDSEGVYYSVMADDCGVVIADSTCDSGSAVASCDGGEPDTNCTVGSTNHSWELEQMSLSKGDKGIKDLLNIERISYGGDQDGARCVAKIDEHTTLSAACDAPNVTCGLSGGEHNCYIDINGEIFYGDEESGVLREAEKK